MLNLHSSLSVSPHVAARARSMRVTKYDRGEHMVIYKVTPWGGQFDHETKDPRLVVFDSKRGTAGCLSLESGEVCGANRQGKLCSHVYAASKRLQASANQVRKAA